MAAEEELKSDDRGIQWLWSRGSIVAVRAEKRKMAPHSPDVDVCFLLFSPDSEESPHFHPVTLRAYFGTETEGGKSAATTLNVSIEKDENVILTFSIVCFKFKHVRWREKKEQLLSMVSSPTCTLLLGKPCVYLLTHRTSS